MFSCDAESNTHPEVCRGSNMVHRERERETEKGEREIHVLGCLEDIHSTLSITKDINYIRAIT